MAGANTGHMRQKTPRPSKGFYSTSTILYWIGFLAIAITIAAGMAYLEVEKLSSGIVQGQSLSQYLISYANLLLLGSAILYVGHLWVTAKSVGQLASGMATLGAMGATVALLVRWLETSHMHQSGHDAFSSLYDATALVSTVAVVIYLAMERMYRTRAAGAFVMPIVVSAALFESLQLFGAQGAPSHFAPALKSYWMHAQILSDFVGYGAFAIAAALGIMYLLREHAEKSDKTEGFVMRSLPDLRRIDRLMFEAIVLGFSTYTLGTILGLARSYAESGEFWSWPRKEVGTLIVWSIYLAYFYGRYMHQWRGSRMAWLAIIGFAVSVFCFAGMNLVLTGRYA